MQRIRKSKVKKAWAWFSKGNEPKGHELWFRGVVVKCGKKYYFKVPGIRGWHEVIPTGPIGKDFKILENQK